MGTSKLEEYFRLYKPGNVIFEEGDVGDTVFLIKSGEVEILKGSGSEQRKLATLGSGELVGEMAMGGGEHERTATVRTVSEVEGWRFPGPAFESLVEEKKEFRQKLDRSLVERLIDTTNRLANQESSKLYDMNQLLARSAFVLLSEFEPSELENGTGREKSIDHPDDYLAYRYGVDRALIQKFRSLNEGASVGDYDDQTRLDLWQLANDVVEDQVNFHQVDFEQDESKSPPLAQALTDARALLDRLEDHSQTYAPGRLTEMMEERKTYLELLEDARENGREDYVVELLEDLLSEIKAQINLRHR